MATTERHVTEFSHANCPPGSRSGDDGLVEQNLAVDQTRVAGKGGVKREVPMSSSPAADLVLQALSRDSPITVETGSSLHLN
jgi:hypothetical protein